jgi:putative transcriptional regulator
MKRKPMTKGSRKQAATAAGKRSKKAASDTAEPSLGSQILEGLREAVAYERGELALPAESVRRLPITARRATATPAPRRNENYVVLIRQRLNLSQPVFAEALNVSPETVRSWEQGKRRPDGAAARLLEIADKHPDIILATVRERKG